MKIKILDKLKRAISPDLARPAKSPTSEVNQSDLNIKNSSNSSDNAINSSRSGMDNAVDNASDNIQKRGQDTKTPLNDETSNDKTSDDDDSEKFYTEEDQIQEECLNRRMNMNGNASANKDSTLNRAMAPPLDSRMSYQEAGSIIGGLDMDMDIPHSTEKQSQNTRKGTSPENSADDAEKLNTLNGRKVFSFSLPFSTSLGSPVQTLRTFSKELKTPSLPVLFTNNNNGNHKDEATAYTLEELSKFDTNIEDEWYKDVKVQDKSRMRAVINGIKAKVIEPDFQFPEINGDVIIMGGYRGSILRDRNTGRRVWIPLKAGFNLRKIDLKVGLRDDDELEMPQYIYPDGMLKSIGPVDIAKKLIHTLQTQAKCNVQEFSYDWRLSLDISSESLHQVLLEFKNKNPNKPAPIIIAHSMGGLIAHHAMQKDPSLVRGLLYVGSPSACPNILGPFRYGESLMLNNKILTAKATFTMRSSYSLLPLSGECFIDAHDTKKHYILDLFDVNTWIQYGLSPCVLDEDNPIRLTQKGDDIDDTLIPVAEAREYLDRTLKRTKKFLEELAFDPRKDYPPLASVFGCSIPTLRHAKVNGLQGIKEGDYNHLRFGNGDGVIYQRSLMPDCRDPRFEVCSKVPSRQGHISLMTDLEAMGKALGALLEEERRRSSH